MAGQITLEQMDEHLNFFRQMYDVVRLVDPVQKRVLDYRENDVATTDDVCHDYWCSGHICDNCISIRCYQENQTYMKLEQRPDSVHMVTALRVDNYTQPIVLELLKDVSQTMMVGKGNYNESWMLQNVISMANDLIIRDSLTSLYNRRFIDERLPVDIVRATLENKPLSILMIDVDNLKKINDSCGHITGDEALNKIAAILEENIRSGKDWVGRYGGDEFLVCLQDTNRQGAISVAERIRQRLQELKHDQTQGEMGITASLGISTMMDQRLTAEEMIHEADRRLYQAKSAGKNRVVHGDE